MRLYPKRLIRAVETRCSRLETKIMNAFIAISSHQTFYRSMMKSQKRNPIAVKLSHFFKAKMHNHG